MDIDSQRLLKWFDTNGRRDLPWRATRDPWAILVSEMMLQQTQVARVFDRFGRFLDRFPTPAACADAPVGDVIDEWAGLGYNRRAVNLHRCAVEIVQSHGGRLPDSLDGLLTLPGIGPYTARAVLAFAHERDVAVLDTNVARILARRSGRRLGRAEAQGLADSLTPPGQGWAWNQAMLDLGATICRSRQPRCTECPVRDGCSWSGDASIEDPAVSSAGVSAGQSTFAGSDRQGRGRLVDAMRTGPVSADDLAVVMGWPDDPARARRVADGVVTDGLAVEHNGGFRLP